MLTQPDVVEAVLTPCDLVEDFAVEAVVRLTPLRSVPEVVPETEPNFSPCSMASTCLARFLVGRQASAAYQGVNVELEDPRGVETEDLRAAFLFQFTHLALDRLRRMRP